MSGAFVYFFRAGKNGKRRKEVLVEDEESFVVPEASSLEVSPEKMVPKLDFAAREERVDGQVKARNYKMLVGCLKKLESIPWEKLDPALSQNSPCK